LKKLIKNSKGITLIEVVISMTLLMFGTIGLIGLMSVSKNQLHLSINKEYLSSEVQSIFENISLYEDLKAFKSFGLNECEPLRDNANKIILNRTNICNRLKSNIGQSESSNVRQITLDKTELNAIRVNIRITNDNDKKTYIFSKVFAVQ
jgi:hypothetical protein